MYCDETQQSYDDVRYDLPIRLLFSYNRNKGTCDTVNNVALSYRLFQIKCILNVY